MAPLPVVLGVYQLTTFGTIRGMPCDHVINYSQQQAPSDPYVQCQALANADAYSWMRVAAPFLPAYYTHTTSRAIYLGSVAVPEFTAAAGGVGTSVSPIIAPQSCVTFRHVVPVRGRGKQGRTNMPGPTQQNYDETTGTLSAAGVAAYQALWNAYQTTLAQQLAEAGAGVVPVSLVVLDRKTGVTILPTETITDQAVNTHRRWEKRLSRHR